MLYRCKLLLVGLIALVPTVLCAASSDDMAQEILTYINQNRQKHWLKSLKMVPSISKEAYGHSLEMANHRMSFGHEGFQTRIKHIYPHIKNPQGGAENIAYNYKTAKIVVDGWMHSPGHRTNILGGYNLTGIGIAKDAQGKLYFTQIFIKSVE